MAFCKHILVALDLEAADDDPVMARASELAKLSGADLSIVHVIEMMYAYGWPEANFTMGDLQHKLRADAEGRMHKIAERLKIPSERVHVLEGSPKALIVDQVRESGADLLVVGTHRRSGLGALILGSTAAGVLQGAECDVHVVRIVE